MVAVLLTWVPLACTNLPSGDNNDDDDDVDDVDDHDDNLVSITLEILLENLIYKISKDK